ncbi:hypothetical protein EBQ74_02835 [bacterium]|nr:hypothetical protein [bacterium]
MVALSREISIFSSAGKAWLASAFSIIDFAFATALALLNPLQLFRLSKRRSLFSTGYIILNKLGELFCLATWSRISRVNFGSRLTLTDTYGMS